MGALPASPAVLKIIAVFILLGSVPHLPKANYTLVSNAFPVLALLPYTHYRILFLLVQSPALLQ